jgi:hypothetical protein
MKAAAAPSDLPAKLFSIVGECLDPIRRPDASFVQLR